MSESDFRFWVPIEKGGVKEEGGHRYVYGVASTEDLDFDEEVVDATGIKKSLDYFLKSGRIDYDHRSKEEPKFIIGHPVEGTFDAQRRFHIKGELYKGKGMEIAEQVWDQLRGGNQRLGWSIGGKVLKRAMCFNKSAGKMVPRVVEALINHAAITPHPKNSNTFATTKAYGDFLKSLANPSSTVGTIMNVGGKEYVFVEREELEKAIAAGGGAGGALPGHVNPIVPQDLESDVKVFRSYIKTEHYNGDANAVKQWFKSQGLADDRAEALAAYLAKHSKKVAAIQTRRP